MTVATPRPALRPGVDQGVGRTDTRRGATRENPGWYRYYAGSSPEFARYMDEMKSLPRWRLPRHAACFLLNRILVIRSAGAPDDSGFRIY